MPIRATVLNPRVKTEKMKFLVLAMILPAFNLSANTSQYKVEGVKKQSSPQQFSLSLKRDVNFQATTKQHARYKDFSIRNTSGTNEGVGTSLAMGYQNILNEDFLYNTKFSFTKIDSTEEGSKASDYIEQIKMEFNLVKYLTGKVMVYGGPNLSKFTRGELLVDAQVGIGFQLGASYFVNDRISFDLMYSEANNELQDTIDKTDFTLNIKTASTTLGVSYIFN